MVIYRGRGDRGGFLKTKSGKEELVSFDLVDSVMALVKKEEQIKNQNVAYILNVFSFNSHESIIPGR